MYAPFKPFPQKELANDFQKLYETPREKVVELEEEWKKIAEENKVIHKENYQKYENLQKEIETFLASKGMKLYEFSARGQKKPTHWFKTLHTNIPRPLASFSATDVPRVESRSKPAKINGIDVHIGTGTGILETYDRIHRHLEREKNANKKRNLLIAAAYKFINDNRLPFDGTPDQAIGLANREAGNKWLEENYPAGTVIDIDDNYCECATYTMGDHRCSCGNRRIDVTVEGDIVDGFTMMAEPY